MGLSKRSPEMQSAWGKEHGQAGLLLVVHPIHPCRPDYRHLRSYFTLNVCLCLCGKDRKCCDPAELLTSPLFLAVLLAAAGLSPHFDLKIGLDRPFALSWSTVLGPVQSRKQILLVCSLWFLTDLTGNTSLWTTRQSPCLDCARVSVGMSQHPSWHCRSLQTAVI